MKKPTAKQIKAAKELLRNAGYFTQNLWSDEDVNQVLRDRGDKELTPEECIGFFDFVGNNHDANIGMNWETLGYMLDQFIVTTPEE